MVKKMRKKTKQYELVTTRDPFSMPHSIYGKNKKSVLKRVRKKLRKKKE